DWPRTTDLSSSPECKGSGIVRDNGSAKTVEASENETPCFVRFSAAFSSSHSNVKLMPDNIRRHQKRRKALNSRKPRTLTVLQLLKTNVLRVGLHSPSVRVSGPKLKLSY